MEGIAFDRSVNDLLNAIQLRTDTIEAIDRNNNILYRPNRWSRLFTTLPAYHRVATKSAPARILLSSRNAIPFPSSSTDAVCAIVVVHGGEPQQGYRFLDVRACVRAWAFRHVDYVSEIGVVLFEMQRALGKARLMPDY